MYILRPAEPKDIDALESLVQEAHIGMTSLPRKRHTLARKLEQSASLFDNEKVAIQGTTYLFVLEDIASKYIVGISGICDESSTHRPTYFFEIKNRVLPIIEGYTLLKSEGQLALVSKQHGPSEVCSLYLHPSARKEGCGRLLSLGRFLFIAGQRPHFQRHVIAEMRGIMENDYCPFWEGVDRPFFRMTFKELIIFLEDHYSLIPEIFPPYPLSIPLLPLPAQQAIGQVHANTRAALHMLLNEGFACCQEIDLFDGGPKLFAHTERIHTIQSSCKEILGHILPYIDTPDSYLLSNEHRRHFRSCMGHVKRHSDSRLAIEEKTAIALKVAVGDPIRYCPLFSKEKCDDL